MIVGERQRQHQAWHEGEIAVHGPHRGPGYSQYGDFGGVDDRRERRAADAAEARDGEAATLHARRRQLSGPSLLGELPEVAGELVHVLAIRIAYHRHHESVG